MTAMRLAASSLRYRGPSLVATFLSIFLGATILMAFMSLLDIAWQPGTSEKDATFLTTVSSVVGGWGILIVAFGVGSTFRLAVDQRTTEIALVKAVGATPRQVVSMIVGEGLLIAVVGTALAVAPGILVGNMILRFLVSADLVTSTVDYTTGAATFGAGIGTTFLAAIVACWVTARRAARVSAQQALFEANVATKPTSRKRIVFGVVLLLVAANCAVLSSTVLRDEGYTALILAGEACIWASVGLALLAPVLMRTLGTAVVTVVGARGAAGHLARQNTRQRAGELGSMLMPIILLTGFSLGTICLQRVHDTVNTATTKAAADEQRGIDTLNTVTLGMLVLFAAVILINSLATTVMHRQREFAQLRLAGATPAQVRAVVWVEGITTSACGLLLGTVAALVGIIPYTSGQTSQLIPSGLGWIGGAIAIGVVAIVVLTTRAAVGRALRTPMLHPAA